MTTQDESHLDGTPEEFPHRDEAMGRYRTLWNSWLVCTGSEQKRALEATMWEEQVRICRGPGKLWHEFAATLPGFEQFWQHQTTDALEAIEKWKHTGGG